MSRIPRKKEFCIEAVEDFNTYESLVELTKTIYEDEIRVKSKPKKNRNWQYGCSTGIHAEGMDIEFHAEIDSRSTRDFKLKIFAKGFSKFSIFRYDSLGRSHYNPDDTLPAHKRLIPTPHFHRFKADGLSYAYQAQAYLDHADKSKFEDINFAVIMFCEQSNSFCNGGNWPKIFLENTQGELFPDSENQVDPFSNISSMFE